jgi:hypothetical protein
MTTGIKLRPVLDGGSWLIGPRPDLLGLLPPDPRDGPPADECVDHHLYRSPDGAWHLWGCIRKTSVGRILYHWEGERLSEGPWRQTGELIRADHEAGESLHDWRQEEWIQSPYVVRHGGTFYMFYGGHGTGITAEGEPVPKEDRRMDCQMCLMTSPDGRTWTRHHNAHGYSRLYLGPGETRDACVLRVGARWHLYYAGYHDHDPTQAGFYVRTSENLIDWSNWRLVHLDRAFGAGPWDTECPHVVHHSGYYYLFRTEDYPRALTHVFRSPDPFDFGIGNASEHYVCDIAVAAPEIVVEGESEYITSNHDLLGGTRICRLRWEEDRS